MVTLDLHYVDELISLRQQQHGGNPGAPPLQGNYRVGASVNRSCIVMLSALLQIYVEEVFKEAAKKTFPRIGDNEGDWAKYWRQTKNWGNPSAQNIRNLFLRVGIPDVLSGLSWQRSNSQNIVLRLDSINQVRNQIAHGMRKLTVDGAPYSLTLRKVVAFRNFSENMGKRFAGHVEVLVDQN